MLEDIISFSIRNLNCDEQGLGTFCTLNNPLLFGTKLDWFVVYQTAIDNLNKIILKRSYHKKNKNNNNYYMGK